MPTFQELWFINQLNLLNQQDLEKSKLWLLHKEIKQKLIPKLRLQKPLQRKNLLSNKSSIKMALLISLIILLQLQPWHNQFQTKRPLKQQNLLFLLTSSKLSKTRLLNKMTVSSPRVRMNQFQLQPKTSKRASNKQSKRIKKQLNPLSLSRPKTQEQKYCLFQLLKSNQFPKKKEKMSMSK